MRIIIAKVPALLALFLWASSALAGDGMVETRDGKSYEGRVRLDTNLVVIANLKKDLLVEIAANEIAEVTFGPERLSEAASEPEEAGDALPSPWQSDDIGSCNRPGSAVCGSGIFRIKSSGTNILGESDSFHFVYKSVRGNSEMVARIISIDGRSPWAKAGLMMRENLNADARNVCLGVTAGFGGLFQWRASYRGDTTGMPAREMSVPYWLRLRRDGDYFSAYVSRSGRHWRKVDTVKIVLPEEIFVGLASSGNNQAVLNRAMIDNLREAPVLASSSFVAQTVLQSGSVLAGHLHSADDRAIQFAGPLPQPPVPTSAVAHILFQWLPFRFSPRIQAGRPGLILSTGEFIEGEFKGIEQGRVTISSVLFGLRSYDIYGESLAVVLRAPLNPKSDCEILTRDGSLWRGTDLRVGRNEIVIEDFSVGQKHLPVYSLKEVRSRK